MQEDALSQPSPLQNSAEPFTRTLGSYGSLGAETPTLRGGLPWWGNYPLQWLLPAICLVPMLFYPLARDQGIFAYSGQVILDGGVPYRDVYEQKGPATHYTFALALWLAGSTPWAIRGMFFIIAWCGSQLAATLGARWAGPAARLPCAVCYALAMLQGDSGAPWHTGQVEDILALLLLASVCLVGRADLAERAGRVFLAGLTLGLACSYKPTVIVPALAIAAVVFWSWRKSGVSWKRTGQLLALATLGLLLPSAIFAGWLAYQGALDDFWMFVVDHNLSVYVGGFRHRLVAATWLFNSDWGRLVLLALLGITLVSPKSRLLAWSLGAVLLGSWGAVIWQGKYWQYHWTPAIAPLAIIAGVGLAWLVDAMLHRVGWKRASWIGAVSATVVIACVAAPSNYASLLEQWTGLSRIARGKQTLEDFQGEFRCGSVNADDHVEVAAWIKEQTTPDDTIAVWGHEAVLHVLSERRSPSRFVLNRTLCQRKSPHIEAWRQEYIKDLQEKHPELIVVVERDSVPQFPQGSVRELQDFPELTQLLDRGYTKAAQLSKFRIYRRVDPAQTVRSNWDRAGRLGN